MPAGSGPNLSIQPAHATAQATADQMAFEHDGPESRLAPVSLFEHVLQHGKLTFRMFFAIAVTAVQHDYFRQVCRT